MISKWMVTGTRDPSSDTELLAVFATNWLAFSPLCSKETRLLQGEARGIDSLVKDLWRGYGFSDKPFPADWDTHGKKAAGPLRNQEMVDYEPQVCLAFPSERSKGTWDAVRRAKKAGIPTFVITDKDSIYKLYHYAILKPGEFLD